MKRIFTSALVILLAVGAAQAQTTAPKKEGPRKEHRAAYQQLNLTPEQKTRLQALNETHRKEVTALKENKSLTEAQQKESRKALAQKHRAAVQAIFTPEQKTQMAKMKAERKAAGKTAKKDFKGAHKAHAKGGERGAGLEKALSLTTDQQAKVKEIRTGFRTQAQTLRADQSLTAEQKKAKMKDLRQQEQAQMKTVLTKEQQEKLQQLRKERAARNTR